MNIVCRLGWHRPLPLARWNNGYYFSTCQRCGRDLIRTAYEGWRVPRGQRIVWSATPPPGHVIAELVAAPIQDGLVGVVAGAASIQAAAPSNSPAASPRATESGGFERTSEAVPAASAREQSPTGRGGLPIEDVFALLRLETEVTVYGGAAPSRTGADSPVPFGRATEPAQAADPSSGASAPEFATETSPGAEVIAEPDHPGSDPDPPVVPSDPTFSPGRDSERDVSAHEDHTTATPANGMVDDDFMADLDHAPWFHSSGVSAGASPTTARSAAAAPSMFDFDWARSAPAALSSEYEHGSGASPEPSGFRGRGPIRSLLAQASKTFARVSPGLVIVVLLPVLLVIGAIRVQVPSAPATVAEPTFVRRGPVPPAAISPVQPTAFVAARLLNCRASPVAGARLLRVLPRGEEVGVLAREPGWASIAHEARQCWVADRYLSSARPL